MFERELVLELVGCPAQDQRVARALQHAPTAFAVGLQDSRGVRTKCRAFAAVRIEWRPSDAASRPGSSSACGGLDPASLPRGGTTMTAKAHCEVVEWCGRK